MMGRTRYGVVGRAVGADSSRWDLAFVAGEAGAARGRFGRAEGGCCERGSGSGRGRGDGGGREMAGEAGVWSEPRIWSISGHGSSAACGGSSKANGVSGTSGTTGEDGRKGDSSSRRFEKRYRSGSSSSKGNKH